MARQCRMLSRLDDMGDVYNTTPKIECVCMGSASEELYNWMEYYQKNLSWCILDSFICIREEVFLTVLLYTWAEIGDWSKESVLWGVLLIYLSLLERVTQYSRLRDINLIGLFLYITSAEMKLDKREGTFEGCYTFKVVSYLAIRTFQEVQDQVVCTWSFVFTS